MSNNELGFDDDFMATMLGEFLDESQGYLGTLNDHLLALDELVNQCDGESPPAADMEMLNEMFRAAHSMKGLSAMLQFHDINALTHRIENVLDAARHQELPLTTTMVEVVFEAVDRLTNMVDQLRSETPESIDYRPVIDQIQLLLAGRTADCDDSATSEECPTVAVAAIQSPPEQIDYFADIHDEVNMEDKYMPLFLADADETLDGLAERLQSDGAVNDANGTLVVCHRIKGAAAAVGLKRPARLAHCMEDLLQRMTAENLALSGPLIEILVAAVEAMRLYLEPLKFGRAPSDKPGEFCLLNEPYARLLTATASLDRAEVQSSAAMNSSQESPAMASSSVRGTPAASEALGNEDSSSYDRIRTLAPLGATALLGRIQLHADLPILEVKVEQLKGRVERFGPLFAWEELTAGDGSIELRFGVATECDRQVLQRDLFLDGVKGVEVITALHEAENAPPSAHCDTTKAPHDPTARVTVAPHLTVDEANETAADPPANNDANGQKSKPTETLRVDIDRLDQLMNLAGQLVINKARFGQIGEQLKTLALPKHSTHILSGVEYAVEKMLAELEGTRASNSPNCSLLDSMRSYVQQIGDDIRVVRRDMDQLSRARSLVNDLAEAVHQLDRVADGIQKSVMDTRMVPVGPLFNRFKRVIRDIARVNGRDVRLVIRGENTELDKRMIDELADPLIHMVRNSADHGIEPPEARQAAGKSPKGTITLDAFHRGNRVFVQVKDDGRGLDPEKIRNKAISKGILSAQDAERLTQQQIFQLIWEPGFSTAEQITEVSGRGMGMDIVRSKIENINGTVELDSVPMQGTTITIKLPLTMAILPSLLTEIDQDVYAIPVESVIEIVSVPKSDLATVHGVPAARIRGRVVSVVELGALFHWASPLKRRQSLKYEDCTLVIVGTDGNEMGLIVDRLLGEQDIVIKSLAENYRNVHGIAGASILGNGRVSLILDVVALLAMQCSSPKQFDGSVLRDIRADVQPSLGSDSIPISPILELAIPECENLTSVTA